MKRSALQLVFGRVWSGADVPKAKFTARLAEGEGFAAATIVDHDA
jgi:hypothetical protein